MIKFRDVLECDVLVDGGGTAGLMAAIYARENGASVIVAEKANTLRSGATATGNDHFQCYIPEVHGTEAEWMELYMHDRPGGQGKDKDLIQNLLKESFDIVKRWEEWGIPMRPHGYWEMQGHTIPGTLGTHLKYAGINQKPILTKQALKAGAKVLNRCPMTEIITDDDGAVIGAICVDLSEEEAAIQVIRCKALVLAASGVGKRLRGSDRMGWMFNIANPPTMSGDAIAAAYRAGARIAKATLRSSTQPPLIATGRFMSRGGKNTWVGVHSNIYGEPICAEFNKPDWRYGPCDRYLDPEFENHYAKGEPIFMDCRGCDQENMDYMLWALPNEGLGAVLDHLAVEGFDFKRHIIEWCDGISGSAHPGSVDSTNGKLETTVPGLYVCSAVANGIMGVSGAAVNGVVAGRSAAEYIKGKALKPAENSDIVKARAEHYSRILDNPADDSSPSWYEANVAIQQIMWSYCGTGVVSDELFEVGLQHLDRIQGKFEQLRAGTAHEFLRCLEVESLAECARIAMLQCRSRKESRGYTKYAGHPDRDPSWDGKVTTIQLIRGEPVLSRRGIREADGSQKES